MAEITLKATPRTVHGTRPSRRLRAEGKIPAVVYGTGGDPVPVTVDWRELRAALTTEQGLTAVIHLDVDGTISPTMVKDIQRHPIRRDVLHVDFLRVDLDKVVEADVVIQLEGEAVEVLRADGVVEQALVSLTVSAKPDQIPPAIVVDVSGLEPGGAIRVGDLQLPAGVTTSVDPEEPVVTAQASAAAAAGEGDDAEAEAAEAAEGGDSEG
jgi:large subunit ribosomal protein L25